MKIKWKKIMLSKLKVIIIIKRQRFQQKRCNTLLHLYPPPSNLSDVNSMNYIIESIKYWSNIASMELQIEKINCGSQK